MPSPNLLRELIMLSILAPVIPVFGIIFIGFFVERLRFLPNGTAFCMNQFVYWISLPALLFMTMASMEPGQVSGGHFGGIVVALAVGHLLFYAILSRGFRQNGKEVAVWSMLSSFPNCVFMGMPIVALLLPGNQTALVASGLFAIITFVIVVFTDCQLAILAGRDSTEAQEGQGSDEGKNNKKDKNGKRQSLPLYIALTLLHNPLLMSSILGAICSFIRLHIPMPIATILNMMGATASPCALFCMGMVLAGQLQALKGKKASMPNGWLLRQVPIHVLKLIVQPILLYVILYLFGVRGVALGVSVIVMGMPTGVASYIISEKYQVATNDSSLCIVISTMLSLVTITVTIAVLRTFGIL